MRSLVLLAAVAALAACGDQQRSLVDPAAAPSAPYDMSRVHSEPVKPSSPRIDFNAVPLPGLGQVELVANGGFEVNDGVNSQTFGSWTLVDAPGGTGSWYVQTGTDSPPTVFPVPAPPAGDFTAMTSQPGPGSHILYQDITLPPFGNGQLSFRLFIGNRHTAYHSPASLSHTGGPNQQFRMDVMDPGAPLDDVGAGVLMNVYQTNPGDPLVMADYITVTADLSAFNGQTVRLRFAEVDNQLYFNAGIDDVSVIADLPAQLNVHVEGSVAPDVAVTVANVQTGQYFVACTDAAGDASFAVAPGNYIVHARNFFICDAADLFIWPNDENFELQDPPNTPLTGRTNAILLNGTSVTLNRPNYLAAVASPLNLGVGPTSVQLQLQQSGAVVTCTLLDGSGNTFVLNEDELVFGVEPFLPSDEPNLPPRLPGIPPEMDRGIGAVVVALPQGSESSCDTDGVAAGDYVFETNAVDVDGNDVVFRDAVTVTEEEADNGETVEVVLEPEPRRSSTGYMFDPLGDAQGPDDLGTLVTYGWGLGSNDQPSDVFIVSTEFVRNGQGPLRMTLEVKYGSTTVQVPVTCTKAKNAAGYTCALDTSIPGASVAITTNPFASGATTGKVTFQVTLPSGVTEVQFRIISRNGNSKNPADLAPNSGYQPASKGGTGNSFAIMAD